MNQNSLVMMPSALNTDPILRVPNATGVPNVNTVPNVPKMSNNGPSVPNPKHWCSVPNVKCTIVHQMYQNSLVIVVFFAPNRMAMFRRGSP